MDEVEFSDAVELARDCRAVVEHLLQDPARSLANLARREEFDGKVIEAWAKEAEDPVRRSKFAAQAVNWIDQRHGLEAPKRRGPHPERDAGRNIAALTAMWLLTERCGLKTPTRNGKQKRIYVPEACVEGGSVCDAVGVAMGWNYKTAQRIWTGRQRLIRRHPLLFMTLWAELPSAAFLGVPLPD